MKFLLLIIVSIFMIGCSGVNQPTLSANYYIKGSYIDIHSPNSENWIISKSSEYKIVFARKDKKDESYIAQVVFFPLEKTENNEGLLELIKAKISIDLNDKRFKLLKTSAEFYDKRPYPCVITKQLVKDTQAKIGFLSRGTLLMETKSLYCRDPKRLQKAGFMVGYSFRGKHINSNLEKEADSFIKGVYFTDL